jgi:hypothetical protein
MDDDATDPTELHTVHEVHIYRDDRFPKGHEPIVFDLAEDVTLQAGETISITWNDRGYITLDD